jgi:hypothetical protein
MAYIETTYNQKFTNISIEKPSSDLHKKLIDNGVLMKRFIIFVVAHPNNFKQIL